jgi:hypothetical protein
VPSSFGLEIDRIDSPQQCECHCSKLQCSKNNHLGNYLVFDGLAFGITAELSAAVCLRRARPILLSSLARAVDLGALLAA